jgi:hypothetical protein
MSLSHLPSSKTFFFTQASYAPRTLVHYPVAIEILNPLMNPLRNPSQQVAYENEHPFGELSSEEIGYGMD